MLRVKSMSGIKITHRFDGNYVIVLPYLLITDQRYAQSTVEARNEDCLNNGTERTEQWDNKVAFKRTMTAVRF